jgi:hypothetical protein
METIEQLRILIDAAMHDRGETNDGIARGAGVASETVRGIRHGRTSKVARHTADRLVAYLTRPQPVAQKLQNDTGAGHDMATPGVLPLAIPQHFASDSDRISFARGVLLMGAETNRITSESSHQVARAIQAAMAALLAPVGVTPTEVPSPRSARPPGQKSRVMAALSTLEDETEVPARPRRRKAK